MRGQSSRSSSMVVCCRPVCTPKRTSMRRGRYPPRLAGRSVGRLLGWPGDRLAARVGWKVRSVARARGYAARVLSVERWPELTEPLMVVALTGWVDAGGAGAGAMAALAEQLEEPQTFGSIDVAELADLQQTRPIARWEGDARVIDWPRITFECGRIAGGREGAGRDVVLVRGPEPSLRWPTVASAIVDAARRLGVRQAVTLGGIPALVSHRKAAVVHRVGDAAVARAGAGAAPPRLRRPDRTADGRAARARRRRDPGLGLWAQVPQYVVGLAVAARDPRAARPARRGVPPRSRSARARRAQPGVPAARRSRARGPSRREGGRRPDRRAPGRRRTGDLVAEIEQFLRSQADGDEP